MNTKKKKQVHDCFIAYISTKKDDFSTEIFWEFSYYLLHQGIFVLFHSEHTLKYPLFLQKNIFYEIK